MKKITLHLCLFFVILNAVFAIKPVKEYRIRPEALEIISNTHYCQTVDSFNIKVWHIPPVSNNIKNISIIVSNGDGGNMANWLGVGNLLAYSGFNVWLYDYRGFGESSDFPIKQEMLYYEEFVKDLSAVVDFVKTSQPYHKVCLLGYSMGTLICMKYLIGYPENIDFCIADGLIYSPEIIAERLSKIYEEDILLPESDSQYFDWKIFYNNLQIPIMLFHGTEDIVCTEEDVSKLKEEVKNLTIIPYTGKHLMGFSVLRGDYIGNIETFLIKE